VIYARPVPPISGRRFSSEDGKEVSQPSIGYSFPISRRLAWLANVLKALK